MKRKDAMELVHTRVDELIKEVQRICGLEEENILPQTQRELMEIKEALDCVIIDNLLSDDIDTKRKILLCHGMSNDAVIILTDATKARIEHLCRNERTQEYGIGNLVECLRATNHVKELFDSEIDDISDLEYVEYDETYDLSDYREKRFEIISMKKVTLPDKLLLEATVDLNGQGDIVYVYLGDEDMEIEDMKTFSRSVLEVYDRKIYEISINKLMTQKEVRELYKMMYEKYV